MTSSFTVFEVYRFNPFLRFGNGPVDVLEFGGSLKSTPLVCVVKRERRWGDILFDSGFGL